LEERERSALDRASDAITRFASGLAGQANLAALGLYTLKRLPDLEESLARGGRDTYTERRSWKRGRELLEETRAAGLGLPVLFGDG
jgi:hypothetical protein